MTSRPSLTYHHERSGDIYVIHLLGVHFLYAQRHIGGFGRQPLVYDNVEELPDGVRHDVEQMIVEKAETK